MAAELTPKQEAFCVAYIQSGNASEAYRGAYDADEMNDASVQREAHSLLRNPKLAPRLAALRADAGHSSSVSLQTHLADLLWLREMAAASGKYSAAVQAEMARGKVVGLYIERFVGSLSVDNADEKKADLSQLSEEEKRVMLAMLERAGVDGRQLQ